MKKKIGFEIQEFHKKGSGPYVYVNNIINSKLSKEFDFKIIDYSNKLKGFSFKRVRDLKKRIIESELDLVNFGGLQLSGFHMALAARIAKKKSIVTVHGFSSDNINISFFKKSVLVVLDFFTLLLADRIIPISDFVKKRYLLRIFEYKTNEVIYNLPTEKKKPLISHSFLKKSKSDILITTVSRVTVEKGIPTILKLAEHYKNNKYIKFIIVGDGNYLKKAKYITKQKKLESSVFFLGFKENVYDVLDESDIFLLPTLHETLSIATLEACKAKLPIICSDTGGLKEIVQNNFNGFLVNKDSVSEFIIAIDKLLNPTLRENMGINSLRVINDKFNQDSISDKLSEIFNSI
jgi:glycosyltransferase involved in cell wall biosynthesis